MKKEEEKKHHMRSMTATVLQYNPMQHAND